MSPPRSPGTQARIDAKLRTSPSTSGASHSPSPIPGVPMSALAGSPALKLSPSRRRLRLAHSSHIASRSQGQNAQEAGLEAELKQQRKRRGERQWQGAGKRVATRGHHMQPHASVAAPALVSALIPSPCQSPLPVSFPASESACAHHLTRWNELR
jgi:hypothetical protein